MKKLLLVIDPQYDFIEGTLKVNGAENKMHDLATKYLQHHASDYACTVITTDWHPWEHCSFSSNGGEWPIHCVQNTKGSSIYQELIEELNKNNMDYIVLRKGVDTDHEEYSIFSNHKSSKYLKDIIESKDINQIDICGIAGDVCVLNSLKDGIKEYGSTKFNILIDYCPSIDDGSKLKSYIDDEDIKTINET